PGHRRARRPAHQVHPRSAARATRRAGEAHADGLRAGPAPEPRARRAGGARRPPPRGGPRRGDERRPLAHRAGPRRARGPRAPGARVARGRARRRHLVLVEAHRLGGRPRRLRRPGGQPAAPADRDLTGRDRPPRRAQPPAPCCHASIASIGKTSITTLSVRLSRIAQARNTSSATNAATVSAAGARAANAKPSAAVARSPSALTTLSP